VWLGQGLEGCHLAAVGEIRKRSTALKAGAALEEDELITP
jgi:hypothetical protein